MQRREDRDDERATSRRASCAAVVGFVADTATAAAGGAAGDAGMGAASASVEAVAVGDPRPVETRTGIPMMVGSIAVDLPDRSQGADEGASSTLWLSVCAFGGVAEDLARCRKGQCISVSGRVQFSRYRTREGERRSQLQVVADTLVAAASQRPRGGGGRRPAGDPRVWGEYEAQGAAVQ